MTTNSEKVTNLSYLTELSKGSEPFIAEMVGIFLGEAPQEISLLEQGVTEKNLKLIKASAHKMRSTIPFVGIDKVIMAELIEIEGLADNKSDDAAVHFKNMQQIETLFLKVKDVYKRAIEELKG